jgi:hypothetical protein
VGRTAAEIRVQAAITEDQITQCQQWLGEEHCLGPARIAGERLFQSVYEGDKAVAVLAWAASAWHPKDRDEWIDWDPLTRACCRKLIVSNWRFLVLGSRDRAEIYLDNRNIIVA